MKPADLLDRLKEQYCAACELHLFCATGRSGGKSYWCRNCQGFYVPTLDRVVRCSGFPGKHPQRRGRSGCHWCSVSDRTMQQVIARQKRPPIEGFIIEDTSDDWRLV